MGSKLKDINRRHDFFYKRAKTERFASRAIYKLQEIDERFRIFKKGMRVLDLGSAPGSWLQYAASKVGPGGRLVGVDLRPLRVALPGNTVFHEGDAFARSADDYISDAGGKFDVVMSDMAPDTIGIRFTDSARSARLVISAATLAHEVLKPTGWFITKILSGEDTEVALWEVRRRFKKVKTVKPESSRKESVEVYFVAWERREELLPPKD